MIGLGVVAITGGVFFASRQAGPLLGHPGAVTGDESRVALQVAHDEAISTIPDVRGEPLQAASLPLGTWPDNVTSVQALSMNRRKAVTYVDGSEVPDDRPVVVVRLLGSFSVPASGPQGSKGFASGNTMTIVADAATGDVLDFGVEEVDTPTALPSSSILYSK
jgi:hypothetical protein